jgi:hypothetical protein
VRELNKIQQLKNILKDEARTEGAAERDDPLETINSTPVIKVEPKSPAKSSPTGTIAIFRKRDSFVF